MSISTSTMTLSFSIGQVYIDSYAMDVNYQLAISSSSVYTVTQYVSIPSTSTVSTVIINGSSSVVTVTNFITGTSLTNYLTAVAPIEQLVKLATASQQAEYLSTYTGTGTVLLL